MSNPKNHNANTEGEESKVVVVQPNKLLHFNKIETENNVKNETTQKEKIEGTVKEKKHPSKMLLPLYYNLGRRHALTCLLLTLFAAFDFGSCMPKWVSG